MVPDHSARCGAGPSDAADAEEWDERYSRSDRVWSGDPNGALVDEVADRERGRALDVGCGEGADAIWLASHGWRVTALDVSAVALGRARTRAAQAGLDIEWLHAGLLDAGLEPGSFELVSAQYPALKRTPGQDQERLLAGLVAPGGTLLFVHHDLSAVPRHARPEHSDGLIRPEQVLAALDGDWTVERNGTRERRVAGGAGSHHVRDIVVRARRSR